MSKFWQFERNQSSGLASHKRHRNIHTNFLSFNSRFRIFCIFLIFFFCIFSVEVEVEATCLASIQRTASGRVLNSTKANPREAPRGGGHSQQVTSSDYCICHSFNSMQDASTNEGFRHPLRSLLVLFCFFGRDCIKVACPRHVRIGDTMMS